ncbi:SAM-dependent methyltransferase, partial [Streptomyces galbus]
MDRHIRTVEDVLRLLDGLFAPAADRWGGRGGGWWDDFYADRSRPVPFFADKPDENLVSARGGVSSVRPGSRRPAPRLAALSSVGDAPHRRPPPPCDA